MKKNLNENFVKFCNYLGTGNPESNIWFVGLEEGGDSVTEENLQEQLSLCEKRTMFLDDAVGNTPVWKIIAELLFDKFASVHNLDYEKYKRKIFLEDYSYFLLTELFPLPRPNNSIWSDQYEKIFGYSQSDYYDYLSDVRSHRFPILYEMWDEKKPLITICFGSSHWSEFINLFKLGHSSFTNIPDSDILHYEKENIFLCPFFDYRILKAKEREILKNEIAKLTI